ncbi:hypothetical protein WISP_26090 [Willisornis vidua]|uniref:Uncharacterized protein n=1 Tax=Willisornis vidua TaxID=1566151 RepID=A0ABQ9DPQ2_9PASS|nr:hypothetical protein WISP_26090 [Willisornis vidua]
MLDTADSEHPERCSALIAHELSRLNIDIAGLSKVHLHEEGSLKEHGAGYTLYWSGKPKTERHLSGVGFMIKNSITFKLENFPTVQGVAESVSMRSKKRKEYINVNAKSIIQKDGHLDSVNVNLYTSQGRIED